MDDSREASQESSQSEYTPNDSIPITPITDVAPHSPSAKTDSTTGLDEAKDDLLPLPSPSKASRPQSQLWRRSSPGSVSGANGSQARRTTVSSIPGNDWAISPIAELSNGQSLRGSIVNSSRNSSISTNSKSSRQPSIQKTSRSGSIFSVLPFLGSPSTPVKEEDPLSTESAFVLSRLENVPLDGAEAPSPTVWLTDQLKSALRTFNDTVVGEVSPGDIDWGIYCLFN